MQYEQDAANLVMTQTALLAIEGTKMLLTITGKGAVRTAAMLTAIVKAQHKSRGAVRLKSLLRSGGALEVFTIPQEQLESWAQAAKRYDVLYTVVKDNSGDGMIDLFVRAEDAPRINRMAVRHGIVLTPEATAAAEPAPEQALTAEQGETQPGNAEVEMDTEQLIAQILAEPAPDGAAPAAGEIAAEEAQEEEFDALFRPAPPDIAEDPEDPPAALSDPPSETPSGTSLPGGSEQSRQSEQSSSRQGNEWTAKRVREEWPLFYPMEEFTDDQRFEIHKGFSGGLEPEQVAVYARPDFTPEQMEQLRLGLEGGLSAAQVKAFAKPELEPATMSTLRQATRPSVREAIARARAGRPAAQIGRQPAKAPVWAVKAGKEL